MTPKEAAMDAIYDYLFLEVGGGAAGREAFIAGLADRPPMDEVIGVFGAQLGWQAAEIAVLVERAPDSPSVTATAIARAPRALACARRILRPTLRPALGDRLSPGGVWVHRIFQIMARDLAEFVALSGEGWEDFEARFDAKVFGLFEVTYPAPRPQELELVLLTRYASHAEWEASRDPSTAAMQTFARRAALTLRTRAVSSVLLPVPASKITQLRRFR
jgi:hypothetical protein